MLLIQRPKAHPFVSTTEQEITDKYRGMIKQSLLGCFCPFSRNDILETRTVPRPSYRNHDFHLSLHSSGTRVPDLSASVQRCPRWPRKRDIQFISWTSRAKHSIIDYERSERVLNALSRCLLRDLGNTPAAILISFPFFVIVNRACRTINNKRASHAFNSNGRQRRISKRGN